MKSYTVEKFQIDKIYKTKELPLLDDSLEENEYFILDSNENSALVKRVNDKTKLIKYKENVQGIIPKDSKQKCFFDSLFDKQIMI